MSASRLAPRLAAKARLRFDKKTGTHMLLYPERGMALNASATAILELCDGERSVDAIVRQLAGGSGGVGCGADPETARRDVVAFLRELARRGLVVGLDEEDPP